MTQIINSTKQCYLSNFIQNFGYLIGIRKSDFKIDYVSENIILLFDNFKSPNQFIDQNIEDIIDFKYSKESILALSDGEKINEYFTHNNQEYFINIYISNNHIHLEFEENIASTNRPSFHRNTEKILYSNNKDENWKFLVDAIKNLTGYNRVFIFKFLGKNSGTIIDEKYDNGMTPYKGMYFPVSNIPEYFSGLYVKKRNRIISNINAPGIQIIGNNIDNVDLQYSELRMASDKHINYLNHFNLVSTFSTSIVINKKLWGLVVCQNDTYKHLPLDIRKQAEILTRLARVSYVNFKFEKQIKFQEKYQNILIKLKENLLINDSLNDISSNLQDMLMCTKATGIAYVNKNNINTFGDTPSHQEILAIKDWAYKNSHHDLYYSNTFYLDKKDEIPISEKSSGVAFKFIDLEFDSFVIWFKKELTIFPEWNINYFDQSFDLTKHEYHLWKTKLNNQAIAWKEKELFIIREVLNLILDTTHVKSFKIRELYDQLQEINLELDSFSYTVSHDLRTPLTVMKLECQRLENSLKEDEKNAKKVKNIIIEIDRLSGMMQDILKLSKAKNTELNLEVIDAETLIKKIVNESKIYNNSENTEIDLGDLHAFSADQTMAYEIFLNLINNAIKYSSKSDNPKVSIDSEIINKEIIYKISDNGIGIKEEDHPKMFQLFSRMSNTEGYRGNGVGLSIVKRMIERLGGSISFESEVGVGTTFTLKFLK